MKYKGVIFDLDGTLLNTIEDIADAVNTTLVKFNFPTHPVESYKYFVGEGVEILLKRSLPSDFDFNNEEYFNTILKDLRIEYMNHLENKTQLYPDIDKLLNFLTNNNLKMAIITNKKQEETNRSVEKFLSKWNFYPVIGSSPKYPNKPNPMSTLDVARIWNISPSNMVFIGDTPIDIETAKSVNMFSIGVKWGFRKEEELRNAGANLIVNNPIEIIDFLGK